MWVATLAIALLAGVAWRYGIITTIALALKGIIVGIWNLLCDIGSTFRDFLREVLSKPIG